MAAKIICFANQKGGVGKSTTTVHVGSAIEELGHRVMVVDADPQNTLVQWSGAGSGNGGLKFPVANLAAAGKMIWREIQKYVEHFDYILVDCPPSVEDVRPAVILWVSDIVVMPTSSSPTDFWSSKEFVRMIEQARVKNEELKAVWLLTKIEKKRMLTRSIQRAIGDTGIPLLKANIANRECYKQAAALGTSTFGMTDRGAKAATEEIREVAAELLALVNS
ncbi:chromosome partitioning protein ParA [Burkholderia sp. Bp9125]|nr:chromosome partitioning protein ParA [Burkholderia sp. Bp9125]